MRILVVDDDPLHLDLLNRLLRAWGHEPEAVLSGAAAMERAAASGHDLFLLDVFLADTTAMQLIPRLRALKPEVPFVTLTGQNSRELELELRQLGTACYLSKPVPPAELKALLDHLARPSRQAAPSRPPAPAAGKKTPADPIPS
jgi:two-component system nitrogen regulation response regulator GlnG